MNANPSIAPHDCYMIAALLRRSYPTLEKRTCVEDPAPAPHRTQGGDFLQWLPQKTGGRDYDKSLFHALRGPIPSCQFTKSISGIVDGEAGLWVNRRKVRELKDLRPLDGSHPGFHVLLVLSLCLLVVSLLEDHMFLIR